MTERGDLFEEGRRRKHWNERLQGASEARSEILASGASQGSEDER